MDKAEKTVIHAHQKAMGYLLAQTHGLFRGHLVRALEDTPLHMGHVVLLASLYAQNDLTQVQLTRIAGVEKSSVVLFLDALEKDGWVERRRHPADRRAHLVHLTDSGRARFAEVGEKLARAQAEALSVFTPDERGRLEDMLLRLTRHLQALA